MRPLQTLRSKIHHLVTNQEQDLSEEVRDPPVLFVTEEVCRDTRQGIRSHSPPNEDHEGVVYWAGVSDLDEVAKVALSVLVPDASTTPGSYHVSPVANAEVIEVLHEYDVELLAVVHSHPGEKTTHSKRDNKKAQLPFQGYYSIVVPDYAEDGIRPFTNCGVHVYRDGQFDELDRNTVKRKLRVVPSKPSYLDTRD
jgi:proteasome lid subunit RPN8/RPN11